MTWHGMLTIDNCKKVANMILDVLKNKKYVFVEADEIYNYKPEVRVNQKLDAKDALATWETEKYAGFHFRDSYRVWGLSTNLKEQKYDNKFNNPYVVIDHDTISMTHRAPFGNKLYWIIKVQ